jgi:histidinol-phosphate aminotransferase
MRAHLDRVHRYPVSDGYELREAIAAGLDLPEEGVVLGSGAADLIELTAITFLDHHQNAVMSDGAFIMYRIAVQRVNGNIKSLPLLHRSHDLDAMAAAVDDDTAIVYVANPNNPTGTYNTAEEFARFYESIPPRVLVVVDEAYREYLDRPDYPDTLKLVRGGARNLMVLRTFSKAHGLAGLRVGYGLMHPELARDLHRVRSPFNVNRMAQDAALAALNDRTHIRRATSINRREREFLTGALEERGLHVTPSVANFLLVDFGCDATKLFDRLCTRGVIVRPVANYGFPESLRITVGRHEEMTRLLEALDESLPEVR